MKAIFVENLLGVLINTQNNHETHKTIQSTTQAQSTGFNIQLEAE